MVKGKKFKSEKGENQFRLYINNGICYVVCGYLNLENKIKRFVYNDKKAYC